MKSSNYPFVFRLAAALFSIALMVTAMIWLKDILVLLASALVLSLLLLPLVSWLERAGLPRSLSILLVLVVSTLLLVGGLTLLSLQVADIASDWPLYVKKFEKYISTIQSFLSKNLNISRKKQMLEVTNQTLTLLKNSGVIIGTTFGTIVHVLTNIILIPIFIFFILYYRSFFASFLHQVFPTLEVNDLQDLLRNIAKVVQKYLQGLLLVMVFAGVLNIIGFWWIGVDYFVFFGVLTGVFLLIPYVGIWLAALLPILLSLITLSPSHAIAVIAWVATVQFIEANFVTPMIIGSKVSMNPMVAMIALLLGETIWGIQGLILALPLVAMLKVIFDFVPTLNAYGFLLGAAPKRNKH
jgi:predicted PurR-regulated permease PerM